MAKAKTNATRGRPRKAASTGDGQSFEGGVKPSATATARLNQRLSGGVTEVAHALGPVGKQLAAQAEEMVEIPRLDHTIIYHGKKYYPTDEPVEIPYGAAFTHGLIGMDENNPPGRVQAKSLVTEEGTRAKATAAEDNGTGGDGNPSGYDIPASDLGSQAITLDEIHEAAEAEGRSTEQTAARREQEIEQRANARRENAS